jgi:hypothetical protein
MKATPDVREPARSWLQPWTIAHLSLHWNVEKK